MNSVDEAISLSNEGEDQDSQGGLKDQSNQSPPELHYESFETLSIDTIQHFTLIPDYRMPTDSGFPILIRTPAGCFCLDGWNLIEQAKGKGEHSISCAVETIPYHSEEDLAIRKVALRVRPKGGIGFYAEIVRNLTLLVHPKDLENSTHGGDRKTEEFKKDRSESIKQKLSVKLGKHITTINQYLNHARFLSEDTLHFLAENGVEKDFFEKIQPKKRWQSNMLIDQGLNEDEITVQISDFMLGWYEDFSKTGRFRSISSEALGPSEREKSQSVEATYDSSPRVTNVEEDPVNLPSEELQIANSPSIQEPPPSITKQSYSLDDVKHDVETSIINPLIEANALSDPSQYYEQLFMAAKHLSSSIQKVMVLRDTKS